MTMTEQQQRVNDLIARIEHHQKSTGLPDVRFVARYQTYLRSSKSWRDRLVARNWTEIGRAITKWELKLAELVNLLDGGQALGDYYDALPITQYGFDIYNILQGQTNDRRVAFIIGPTGVGKSWVLKRIAEKNEGEAFFMYATESWHESMPQIAKAFAQRVGATIDKTSGRKTFDNVTALMRAAASAGPVTFLIDDVQKGGILGLKMIKGLVDATLCRFILAVYPDAWNRLIHSNQEALSESQQIYGRTIKPIAEDWKAGLRTDDIVAYMKAAGVTGDIIGTATRMANKIRANGNLRLLADAVGLAKANTEEKEVDCDASYVSAAVECFVPSRREAA